MPAVISSIKDGHLALVRSLDGRSARAAAGACVLDGAALIGQALEAGCALRVVLHSEGATDPLLGVLREHGVLTLPARETLLRQALRLTRPVSWVAVAELPPVLDGDTGDAAGYGDVAVVLDDVQDPGNLGAIVRTAVGLGVLDMVCTAPDMDLSGRKVLDASRAAALRARVHRFATPLAAVTGLRERGFEVVATSSHATTPQSLVPLRGRRVALVVGNETAGVGDDVLAAADHVVRIPMGGAVESLNVAVSTGISLYEMRAMLAATDPARGEVGLGLERARTAVHRVGEAAALAGLGPAERATLVELLGRLAAADAPS